MYWKYVWAKNSKSSVTMQMWGKFLTNYEPTGNSLGQNAALRYVWHDMYVNIIVAKNFCLTKKLLSFISFFCTSNTLLLIHHHHHHWLSFVSEDDFLWTMSFHWHLFLLRDCQLPTGIFSYLRFLITVSLNLNLGLLMSGRPSSSWEYRIGLDSLEPSILCK